MEPAASTGVDVGWIPSGRVGLFRFMTTIVTADAQRRRRALGQILLLATAFLVLVAISATSVVLVSTEEFRKLYVAYKAETNFVDVIPQAKPVFDIVQSAACCETLHPLSRDIRFKARLNNPSLGHPEIFCQREPSRSVSVLTDK
jgi:hypothetical protein